MSDDPKNGTEALKPKMLTPAEMQTMMIEQWSWPVLCSAVNGLQMVLLQQQRLPVGAVTVTIARLLGKMLGHALSMGDFASIISIRAECIKAFTEAVRAVKVEPPAMPLEMATSMPQKH